MLSASHTSALEFFGVLLQEGMITKGSVAFAPSSPLQRLEAFSRLLISVIFSQGYGLLMDTPCFSCILIHQERPLSWQCPWKHTKELKMLAKGGRRRLVVCPSLNVKVVNQWFSWAVMCHLFVLTAQGTSPLPRQRPYAFNAQQPDIQKV